MTGLHKHPTVCAFVLFVLLLSARPCHAEEVAFPLLPGLEGPVEFWKQIFTRYSSNEVVFHDPVEPTRIYSVVAIPENDQARASIERERARIIADFDLREEDNRVRAQRGVKERFLAGLKAAGKYLQQMQKIFRDEGVPVELTYLPLVESSFNLRARSSAGAVGIWQFMPGTARKFMRVNKSVDERKDPVVSTRAAARLLKENYKIFGNWPLAVTAYNHGTEGIQRGVGAVESDNLVDIIRVYRSPTFGFASKSFYAEFLAALEVAKNSDAYFPAVLVQADPVESAPAEKPAPIARKLRTTHHRVSQGETLSHVAKLYRVSVGAIQRANGLGTRHSISAGQRLRIPTR